MKILIEYLYQVLLSVKFRIEDFIKLLNSTHCGTVFNAEESNDQERFLDVELN